MPETPHHAFELTISPRDHTTGSITKELHDYLKNHTLWYAMKHETGENGKVHIHVGFVFEIGDRSENPKAGARTASSAKRTIIRYSPALSAAVSSSGGHAVLCTPMRSDRFIEYLQKEGDLQYHDLPLDITELRNYFADLLGKKLENSDYIKWGKMYEDDKYPIPVNPRVAWDFFQDKFATNEIRIVADKKKLMDRCVAFTAHMNRERAPNPFEEKPKKRPLERICPQCEITPLQYRKQLCGPCLNENECNRDPKFQRQMEMTS